MMMKMGDTGTTIPSPGSVVNSKVTPEEHCFLWEIHNFKMIAANKDLIGSTYLNLDLGTKAAHLAKWKIFLFGKEEGGGYGYSSKQVHWIGVGFQPLQYWANANDIAEAILSRKTDQSNLKQPAEGPILSFQLTIRKGTGKDIVCSEPVKDCCFNGRYKWIWNNVIQNRPLDPDLILVDNTLRIEMKAVFTDKAKPSCELYKELLQEYSIGRLLRDIPKVFPEDTIEVVSNGDRGGGCVTSSKALLSARSSALATAIQENPQLVNLHLDMSSEIMKIFMDYLQTGSLAPGTLLKSHEIITSLAHAAQTFDFPELHEYCDEILAERCTLANWKELLGTAKKLGMIKAIKGILQFVKFHEGNTWGSGAAAGGGDDVKNKTQNTHFELRQHYNSAAIASSGLHLERCSFTWMIQDINGEGGAQCFDIVKKMENLLDAVNNVWQFSLKILPANTIKISYKSNQNQKSTSILACLKVLVNKINGVQTYFVRSSETEMASVESGKLPPPLLITLGATTPLLQTLELQIQLTVAVLKSAHIQGRSLGGYVINFQKDSKARLLKDLERLYTSHPSHNLIQPDVILISMEGQQFPAHWQVLSARCEIFETMFNSNLEERREGVIKLKDTSASTVKALLHFLYAGQFESAGFSDGSRVVQVAHVADKYMLPELKNYCDFILAEKCQPSNVWELLAGAERYGLDYAKSMITNYIVRMKDEQH